MKRIPQYSVDLIKQLERDYPEDTIVPGLSNDAIMFKAGMRKLVKQLRAQFEADEEDAQEVLRAKVESWD